MENQKLILDLIAVTFSIVAFTISVIFSIITFSMSRKIDLYKDIDGMYLELLKISIEHPKFVDAELTKNYKKNFQGKDLLAYEQYAYISWNIMETILDRRQEGAFLGIGGRLFKRETELYRTWKPVIKTENNLHRQWLNDKENQHKFKPDFWKFIIKNEDYPCPDCEPRKGDALCSRCRELLILAEQKSEMPIAALTE